MLMPKAHSYDPAGAFSKNGVFPDRSDAPEIFGRDMQILQNSLRPQAAQSPDLAGHVYGYTRNNFDNWASDHKNHPGSQNGRNFSQNKHNSSNNRTDNNDPGNTASQQQTQAAYAKAAQTQQTLKASGGPPSPDKTAKTGEAKTASAGGKQQAEEARKQLAEAKEAGEHNADAEVADATTPGKFLTGQAIAHASLAAGGVMIGAPGAAGMVSMAMTAYDGMRAMQSPNASETDSNADASPTVAELEQQEKALAALERDHDQDLSQQAEREASGIDSINADAGTQVTFVTEEELANVGMLQEITPAFAPGHEPFQATDALLANTRIYGYDRSDSGTDKADSTLDPNQRQQYELAGGPDVMTPVV